MLSLLRLAEPLRIPPLSEVALKVSYISHTMLLRELVSAADDSIIYVRPNITRFKLLDYHLLPDIVEAGAAAARLVIDRAESRALHKCRKAVRRASARSRAYSYAGLTSRDPHISVAASDESGRDCIAAVDRTLLSLDEAGEDDSSNSDRGDVLTKRSLPLPASPVDPSMATRAKSAASTHSVSPLTVVPSPRSVVAVTQQGPSDSVSPASVSAGSSSGGIPANVVVTTTRSASAQVASPSRRGTDSGLASPLALGRRSQQTPLALDLALKLSAPLTVASESSLAESLSPTAGTFTIGGTDE